MFRSRVLNPAVRADMEWKNELKSLSDTGRSFALLINSSAKIMKVPAIIRIELTIRTILECNVNLDKPFFL